MNRFVIAVAACALFAACSSSSGVEQPEDGGVLPDGGDTPDGGDSGIGGASGIGGGSGTGGAGGGSGGTSGTSGTGGTGNIAFTDEPPDVAPTDFSSSIDSIEAARTSGSLDDVDAIRYKVFATFGDPRLPAEFVSDGRVHGTQVMEELAAVFDSLPANVQEELWPFRLAPSEPGNWLEAIEQQGPVQKGNVGPLGVDIAGGKVRLTWSTTLDDTQVEAVQSVLAAAIEFSHARLVGLMGEAHEPIPHVLTNPYSIHVFDFPLATAYGSTYPRSTEPGSSVSSSHITINLANTGPASNEMTAATAAHELMHAIQNTYDVVDDNSATSSWLKESTATWSEHFVFPINDTEHEYTSDLTKLGALTKPLDDISETREYAGYLFHQFAISESGAGNELIPRIWELSESSKPFPALDTALGGKLTELWPKFVARLWNADPLPFFQDLDGLSESAFTRFGSPLPRPPLSNGQVRASLRGFPAKPLSYLSAEYVFLDMSDPELRTIVLANGLSFDLKRGTTQFSPSDEVYSSTRRDAAQREGLSVQVMVKANGAWMPEAYDVTDVAYLSFCNDYAEERVDEIVVIFSNGRWKDGDRTPVLPNDDVSQLFLSNMGCGDWAGTASMELRVAEPNRTLNESLTVDPLRIERARLSREMIFQGAGQRQIGDEFFTADGGGFSGDRYTLIQADAVWSVSGESQIGDDECVITGSGSFTAPQATARMFDIRPTLLEATAEATSLYRSFFITVAFSDPGPAVTQVCLESGSSTTPFFGAIGAGFRGSEFGVLTVTGDGKSINETFDLDDAEIRLRLDVQSDP